MPQSALNMPHRLSRGSPKGASAGMSLARDEKCATAARVGLNTSRQPCKIAGEEEGGQKRIRLRVGTVNVGTMSRKVEKLQKWWQEEGWISAVCRSHGGRVAVQRLLDMTMGGTSSSGLGAKRDWQVWVY